MTGYYQLKDAAGGKTRFTLHAANHEVILTSQIYAEKRNAEAGIASTQENGQRDERFDRKVSVKGEPYFSLKAKNGQIIGTSEMYSSEAARDNGIRSVIANSATTTVKDLTTL